MVFSLSRHEMGQSGTPATSPSPPFFGKLNATGPTQEGVFTFSIPMNNFFHSFLHSPLDNRGQLIHNISC